MTGFKESLEKQEKIACLLAVYEKHIGNCTKVIFATGKEVLLKQSVDFILQAIAKHYTIDLKQLRKKQQNLLNCRYYVPLPLSKDILFIPIKTRTPRVKKDPSISYINYYEIRKLDSKKPIIYLKNNSNIESLNTLHIVKKRYNQGEICAKLYKDESNSIVEEKSPTYYYPATKGDLQRIAEEINDLKEFLKGLYIKKDK